MDEDEGVPNREPFASKADPENLTNSGRASRRTHALVCTGIAAAGCDGQPAEVVRPTFCVGSALCIVRKTAMGHAQQRAAVAVNKIDLDQARSGRHLLAVVP